MSHANAPLTPEGRRRLAILIVDEGWSIRRAAQRLQVSPSTAQKWAARYRAGLPLTDRSSRPRTSPNRLPKKREHRILSLRFNRRWGPHRISYHLGIPRSTVGRVLQRYRMPRLDHIDQATGLPIRKPKPLRYEMTRPGELVHVDIKKLGRIPDGGGIACSAEPSAIETTRSKVVAIHSCITPLMITHDWHIPRFSPMNEKKPRQRSGNGHEPSSQPPGSWSPG